MKLNYALMLGALLATPVMAAQNCNDDFSRTAPNGRFAKFDNGTVKDLQTGLTWMRCPLGETWDSTQKTCTGKASGMLWSAALAEVVAINGSNAHALHHFGGKTTWRLPNIKELISLKESACYYPAINNQAFPVASTFEIGFVPATWWSSTPASDGSSVYIFDASDGNVFNASPTQASRTYGALLVAEE